MAIVLIVMLEDDVSIDVDMGIPPMVLVGVPGIDIVTFILMCNMLRFRSLIVGL
jgi:hypothetical protein